MSELSPEERLEVLDRCCAVINHPARRQILMTLHFRGGSMSAGAIARRFSHAWPTTTRHLGVLEKAGLVRSEKRGRERIYHLERGPLQVLVGWLGAFEGSPTS